MPLRGNTWKSFRNKSILLVLLVLLTGIAFRLSCRERYHLNRSDQSASALMVHQQASERKSVTLPSKPESKGTCTRNCGKPNISADLADEDRLLPTDSNFDKLLEALPEASEDRQEAAEESIDTFFPKDEGLLCPGPDCPESDAMLALSQTNKDMMTSLGYRDNVAPAPTPEPSTLLLFGTGAGLGALTWRRRKRSACFL